MWRSATVLALVLGSVSSARAALALASSAFAAGAPIPIAHTCDGADESPALSWRDVPAGTTSLALIVDDGDAPGGAFTHWVLYDLPAETTVLAQGAGNRGPLPAGAREGRNDFRRTGWSGPCPPPGKPHRYTFQLFALDARLGLAPGTKAAGVRAAMEGHVLGRGTLMGTYER